MKILIYFYIIIIIIIIIIINYVFGDLDSSRFILGMNFFADVNLAGLHLESEGYCSELGWL